MTIRARDIMQPNVLTVAPEMSLAELADFLIASRIGGVPVVDDGTLVGIVSRSDIVRSLSLERSLAGLMVDESEEEFAPGTVAASPPLPKNLSAKELAIRTVREVMVADVVTVAPDMPISDVANVLVQRHLHRVLVTEGKAVCGMISVLDLARLIGQGRLSEA
jgi:CBS domain-containing protein